MLTAAKIKLIYCYLVCLFLTIWVVFEAATVTQDFLKLKNLDETYHVADYMISSKFHSDSSSKKYEKTIEEGKINKRKELKSRIIGNISYLFYSLLTLGIHIILIRTTKEH